MFLGRGTLRIWGRGGLHWVELSVLRIPGPSPPVPGTAATSPPSHYDNDNLEAAPQWVQGPTGWSQDTALLTRVQLLDGVGLGLCSPSPCPGGTRRLWVMVEGTEVVEGPCCLA